MSASCWQWAGRRYPSYEQSQKPTVDGQDRIYVWRGYLVPPLSSENNLPMFRLNAPVVIREHSVETSGSYFLSSSWYQIAFSSHMRSQLRSHRKDVAWQINRSRSRMLMVLLAVTYESVVFFDTGWWQHLIVPVTLLNDTWITRVCISVDRGHNEVWKLQ